MDATEQLKIFVCWSGERGRGFAEACQKWLGDLFPERVNVLISVEIEKGTVWFDELTDSLRGARLGIICLTPEGIDSPWVHFEAGMLAKVVHEDQTLTPVPGATRSRILPFLLGVEWALRTAAETHPVTGGSVGSGQSASVLRRGVPLRVE